MSMFNVIKKMVPWPVKSFVKETIVAPHIKKMQNNRRAEKFAEYENGINLIGPIKAEMGLGQSCRLVAKEILETKQEMSVYNIGFSGNLREQDGEYDKYASEELPYAVNLFHVNPCELGWLIVRQPDMWKKHYNIAFWLWELEEFPKEWIKYCQLFDEIWTPSDFAGKGVKEVTDVPVRTMPYSVEAPYDEKYKRSDFGLPENQFLFLVMYDLNSTNGRKNPQGAIEAYRKAFTKEREDCGIVIKVNNATQENIEMLRSKLPGYKNIYFITEIMDKVKVNSLIRCVDVFVSLHRAEGFGLVMAEAMLLGTPVVTTNWSSNTEFMCEESSCMVGYDFVTIKKREGLYKKGYRWAEPDTDEAGRFMRRLVEDPQYYESKKQKGKEYIDAVLGQEKITALWRAQIDECYEKWYHRNDVEM